MLMNNKFLKTTLNYEFSVFFFIFSFLSRYSEVHVQSSNMYLAGVRMLRPYLVVVCVFVVGSLD